METIGMTCPESEEKRADFVKLSGIFDLNLNFVHLVYNIPITLPV